MSNRLNRPTPRRRYAIVQSDSDTDSEEVDPDFINNEEESTESPSPFVAIEEESTESTETEGTVSQDSQPSIINMEEWEEFSDHSNDDDDSEILANFMDLIAEAEADGDHDFSDDSDVVVVSEDEPDENQEDESDDNQEDEAEEPVEAEPIQQEGAHVDASSSRPPSRTGMSPPRKVAKLDGPNLNTSEDDGGTCTICYEMFTNAGEHRISCLKCGHVFGKSCIEKWLRSHGRCPQCNCKATRKDVRVLYVNSLKAMDNTELTAAKSELEKSQNLCSRINLESHMLKVNVDQLSQKVKVLEEENLKLTKLISTSKAGPSSAAHTLPGAVPSTSSAKKGPPGRKGLRFGLAKFFELKEGTCRVGAYNEGMNMLVVSQEIKNSLYPNGCCGIKQLNMLELKPSQFLPIHQKQIRDMAFSSIQSDVLLTVGLDKKAILFNCNGNVTVQQFPTEAQLWSCAWDEISPHIFYVGTNHGQIISYDIRSPQEAVSTFSVSGTVRDTTPVARIKFIRQTYQTNSFNLSGLLVQKLNSVWFCELQGGNGQEMRHHQLPLEGSLINVDFEPVSRHVLVSSRHTRPSTSLQTSSNESTHMVCDLTQYYSEPLQKNVVSTNLIRQYQVGNREVQRMCRPSIFSPEEGYVYVCANGPSNSVKIWDISLPEADSGYIGPAPDFTLDFVRARVNKKEYMALVAEKGVRVFEQQFGNW